MFRSISSSPPCRGHHTWDTLWEAKCFLMRKTLRLHESKNCFYLYFCFFKFKYFIKKLYLMSLSFFWTSAMSVSLNRINLSISLLSSVDKFFTKFVQTVFILLDFFFIYFSKERTTWILNWEKVVWNMLFSAKKIFSQTALFFW